MTTEAFKNQLEKQLNALQWTHEELASRAGIDSSFVSKLRHGRSKPSLDTLFRLCKAFEIRPSRFVEDIECEVNPALSRIENARGKEGSKSIKDIFDPFSASVSYGLGDFAC